MDCPKCHVPMELIEESGSEFKDGELHYGALRYRCPKCKQIYRWSFDNIEKILKGE